MAAGTMNQRRFDLTTLALAAFAAVAVLLSLLGHSPAWSADAPILAMAILASTHPTLLDYKARLDPNDRVGDVIEALSQTNQVLDDIPWVEGNELTGHVTTVRTGIPEPTWRKLYGGVQPSKSTTAKIREGVGMLEAYAEIDKSLADLNGNSAAWRMSEEKPFIEGFGQKFGRYLFYGNEASEPEGFTGLAPRFSTNDTGLALNAENVLAPVATPDNNDNSSIWLVVWGPNTVHGIYPKGSKAGIGVYDKGQVTIENIDGAGGRMEAYRTHFKWDCGLAVRDWRYVVRIQVDTEDLVKDAASGPDLTDLMMLATEQIPNLDAGKPVFYANRTIRSFLRRQMVNKTKNSTLSIEKMGTRLVPTFDGIPIRRVDQLLNTEAGV